MRRSEVYKRAILLWGVDLQLGMAIQEMAELTKAITEYWRHPVESHARVVAINEMQNEIADVEIMMAQLRMMFDTKTITKKKSRKIRRLIRRLEREESHD